MAKPLRSKRAAPATRPAPESPDTSQAATAVEDAPAPAPAPAPESAAAVRRGSLTLLQPDNANANRHTPEGMQMLENVIRRNGLGRGIVVDRNMNIIGGNGVVEAAMNAGLERAVFVPVKGDELVVTVREDVEIDSPRGRELALADNSIGAMNLDFDEDVIRQQAEAYEIDRDQIGLSDRDLDRLRRKAKEDGDGGGGDGAGGGAGGLLGSPVVQYAIIFDDEDQQKRWFNFVRWLNRKYPEAQTLAARLDLFLETISQD